MENNKTLAGTRLFSVPELKALLIQEDPLESYVNTIFRVAQAEQKTEVVNLTNLTRGLPTPYAIRLIGLFRACKKFQVSALSPYMVSLKKPIVIEQPSQE